MNRRWILTGSLVLNGLLGLAIATSGPAASRAPTNPAPPKRSLTPSVMRPTEESSASPTAAPPTFVETFHWSQVSDLDYARYRDRLRAVGCPETTLRTLMESVIVNDYAERMRRLVRPLAPRFWELLARSLNDDDVIIEATIDQLQALDRECRGELERVLGANRGRHPEPVYVFDETQRQLVDFLSPERQAQYAEIQWRFAQSRHWLATQAKSEDRRLSREERSQLKEKQTAELRAWFTEDEWIEYQLRTSPRAKTLRSAAMEWSPDEVRTLTRLLVERDPSTASSAADSIRSFLGEERYAEYKRAQSQEYQQLRRVIQRYGVPESVAIEAHAVVESILDQARELKESGEATPSGAPDPWTILREQAETHLESVLGSEVYRTYRRYGGDFLNRLGRDGR